MSEEYDDDFNEGPEGCEDSYDDGEWCRDFFYTALFDEGLTTADEEGVIYDGEQTERRWEEG